MKMKEKDTFLFRGSKKTVYFMTLVALLAMGAIAYLSVPFNNAGTVSAQQSEQQSNLAVGVRSRGERATPGMISYALSNRTNNMADTISALNQLPCDEIADTELGGKSFGPGVYCLSSARLAGELTLVGDANPDAVFIFNVAGTLDTMENSRIALTNGAQSHNVFFVADAANVGSNNDFRAAILAKNAVTLNENSRVAGKVFSLTGQIAGVNDSPDGGGTGTVEICKEVSSTFGNLENRIFFFTITGVNIPTPITRSVRAGFCTAPFDVPNGPAVVTELLTGTTLNGDPTNGNFVLTNVRVIQASTPSPSTLGAVNLAARTAAITVADSGVNNQLTLEFTNRFAITGFVEICKRATDVDVTGGLTGTFTFTVEGVFAAGSNTTLQQFTAPVGQCTGAISVTRPFDGPGGLPGPREGTVRVTELGQSGAFLVSANTIPANREIGTEVLGLGVNGTGGTFTNSGGGYITVRVLEGDQSLETIIEFFNRSSPGLLKVCKIAGPGIALNRLFSFTVTGTGPTTAAGTTVGTVTRTFDVAAGLPADGGTCTIVPGFGAGAGNAEFQTFVIGTTITITENPEVLNNGTVRVSRVRVQGSTGVRPSEFVTQVIARRDFVEVEYTNFRFVPTILKVCKIAGAGVALNTPFTFTTTFVSPTGSGGALFPAFSTTTTVNAGPAAQGGNCNIVNGGGLIGGAFNIGSTVTVAENAAAGTIVSNITSTTSVIPAFVAGSRITTLTGDNGLVDGVTQVTFTNAAAPATPTPTPTPVASPTPTPSASPTPTPSASPTPTPTPGVRTFAGTGVGAIPDGSPTGLTVSFPVTGVTGPITSISLSVTMTHTWVGDLQVILRSPNGTAHTIFDRIGVPASTFGDSSNLGGTYVFNDAATGNIITAAAAAGDNDIIPPGSYRTTNAADAVTSLVASFSGLTAAQANGTWTLTFVDAATPDVGTVTAASLTLGPAAGARAAYDFDGDSKADLSVFRQSNGTWYINRSRDGFMGMAFGQNGDRIVPADYDGDGKTDIAVFRSGNWYLQQSTAGFTGVSFGEATDIPMPADYDGDGRADIAVFRPSTGVWYLLRSSAGFTGVTFGQAGDRPVAADYDNDGKADVAVYRNGTWYIMGSTAGFSGTAFGEANDKPVVADYDGDGRADIAVFRASSGTWYIMGSTSGFRGVAYGESTDVPSAADFDGDGRADIAVFRPSTGFWYVNGSTAGHYGVQFGLDLDRSVPNAFVR